MQACVRVIVMHKASVRVKTFSVVHGYIAVRSEGKCRLQGWFTLWPNSKCNADVKNSLTLDFSALDQTKQHLHSHVETVLEEQKFSSSAHLKFFDLYTDIYKVKAA